MNDNKQRTIFVVDDVGINLSMAEAALEDHYRVITISSAEKMFKILQKLIPDLILLDIEMPEMDGFEAMTQLQANTAYAKVPVIFLTGTIDDERTARGKELGAVDFVTKPFSGPELLALVKSHLD